MSGSSSYYSSESSVWTETSELPQTHFEDGYNVAEVVFAAIYIVVLLAIAIWSATVKKRGEVSQFVLRFLKFGIAMFFVLM